MRERFFIYTDAEKSEILEAISTGTGPKRGRIKHLFALIETAESGPWNLVFTEKQRRQFRASEQIQAKEIERARESLDHLLGFIGKLTPKDNELKAFGASDFDSAAIAAAEALNAFAPQLDLYHEFAEDAFVSTKSDKGSRYREYTEHLFDEIKQTWLDFGGRIDSDNKKAYERFFLAVAKPALTNKTIGDEFNVGLNTSTFSEHYKKAAR